MRQGLLHLISGVLSRRVEALDFRVRVKKILQ
jgi:hypothetical protein